MAQDNSILERIEKQMEGTGLAMAAVAEVLQKMDGRLAKAENDEDEEREEEEQREEFEHAAMEKAMIIKAVSDEVVDLFKAGQYGGERGMPVGPTPDNKASATGPNKTGGASADDSETGVTIDSKTENVQHTIQAMQLQLASMSKDISDMEEEEAPDDDDDEESEDNIQAGYYGKLENMQKQIMELSKAQSSNNSMENMIQKETESRLRKMGFREETSLQRPTRINYDAFGVDNIMPITKSGDSEEDTVNQLTNLSYKQLRDMQFSIENGNTDGVPQELL